MSLRNVLAAIIGVAAAALFARLGVWQLHRLAERRARNAQLLSRLGAAPVSPPQLPADSALARFRRVRVTGTFDFDHQLVLGGRSHDGAPGVYLITPLRPDSGGAAVLVNRGWVYSPDASTVDLGRWDETPHITVDGYVDELASRGRGPARLAADPRVWRWLDGAQIASTIPYPIAPYYVVALAPAGTRGSVDAPARLGSPPVDEGPHKSYAIQWFSFAAIALVGAGLLIWNDRARA